MTDQVLKKKVRLIDIFKGIGLVIIMLFLPAFIPIIYFIIGLVQFIYIIPAIIICRKNKGMVIGILIGAALTLVVNAVFVSMTMNNPEWNSALPWTP